MIIYLTFIFVMIVLLLNLLIAQMNNTYSTILNEAQYAMLLNRAWIVARVEHNSFFGLILLYTDKLCAKLQVILSLCILNHPVFPFLILQCCRRNNSQIREADGSNTVIEQKDFQLRFYEPYEEVDPQGMLFYREWYSTSYSYHIAFSYASALMYYNYNYFIVWLSLYNRVWMLIGQVMWC